MTNGPDMERTFSDQWSTRKGNIAFSIIMIWYATMATQVNIRFDDDLLTEIDAMAKVLHISRTEWIRIRLAQALQHDTLNLTEVIILEYSKGRISDDELNELLGKDAEDIRYIFQHVKRGKKDIIDLVEKGML